MKFLFLGTLLDSEAFTYDQAANPASTKWLSGLLGGLAVNGDRLSICGHCYSRSWPKGALFPGKSEYLDQRHENHLVRFVNFPCYRFRSLQNGYFRAAEKLMQAGAYDAIVTYNPYQWHTHAARLIRRKYRLPWVCLNLDFDDVGPGWSNFLKQAGDADGHLFLSYWGYKEAPVHIKIHLDSGVDSLAQDFGVRPLSNTINIVYLGKLSKSGGLEALLALPKFIEDTNVRFIYCGKGYPDAVDQLESLSKADARVDFRGFVEEKEVEDLFSIADIFINPRDPNDVVNDMVFPSKIMHYLKTGKTVVSTWTKGLDPAYRDLMLISESPSIRDFALMTAKAVAESMDQRLARSQRIKGFLTNSRLWRHQAERFGKFVESICGNQRGDDWE